MSTEPLNLFSSQPSFVSMTTITPSQTEPTITASTNSGLDANSWLNQQRRTRLNSIEDISTFVASIYNLPAQSLPNLEKLLEAIDAQYTLTCPNITNNSLTNPQSQPYPNVLNTVNSLLTTGTLKVLYSTPINNQNLNTTKVAILLPDQHTNAQEKLNHYDFLLKAFSSNDIQMSSGFSEGQKNPQEILKMIPKGTSSDQIRDYVLKNGLDPEIALLYVIQEHGIKTGSQSFAAFSPEPTTTTKTVRMLMRDVISIASGAYPTFFPTEYYRQGIHYLNLLRHLYQEFANKNLKPEFFAMFTTIMKQQLNQLKLSDEQKRQIVSEAITILFSPSITRQNFLAIPQVIANNDYDDLHKFYLQERSEIAIKPRNIAIAETFNKEPPGTRLMIIGSEHIISVDYSLVKLLEQKQIPVIVVGDPTKIAVN